MKTGIFATLAAISFVVPNAAIARPELVSATVQHSDLDLTTRAGLSALKQRVRSAVEQVCAEAADGSLDQRLCVIKTRRIAEREISRVRARSLAMLELPAG